MVQPVRLLDSGGMARERHARPVVGRPYRDHRATQEDVDAYERQLALVRGTVVRCELRAGRLLVVKSLPSTWAP